MTKKLTILIFLLVTILVSTPTLAKNQLISSKLITLSAHRAKLILNFSQIIKHKPLSFVMSDPQRIIVDFTNASSSAAPKHKTYHSSLIRDIQTVDANNKIRMIIRPLKYANYTIANSFKTVTISFNRGKLPPGSTKLHQTSLLKKLSFTSGKEENSGQLTLSLSNNSVQSEIQNRGNQVILTLKNTTLAKNLAHKYDVSDYKTPAQSINVFRKGREVQLIVSNKSKVEVTAYQLDKKYVLNLVPAIQSIRSGKNKFHGKRISLNFQQIPVRSVLQILAEFMGSNIIISNNVQGNISLRLEQVPWDQALNIILKTQGLVKREVGNIVMIAPAGEITAQEKKLLLANEEMKNLGPLESEIFHIKYGKSKVYYDTLKDSDNTLLSRRGKIIFNKRTNMLFVTDTPEKLQGIKHYILKTDIPVKQVEIEARIVTVDKSFERQLGIKWNVKGSKKVGPGGSEAGNGFNLDLGANSIGGAAPATLALATLSNDILIGLELSALEAEGGGEILSSPRLLTADQQEAIIEQGTEIPYAETTSSGAAAIAFKQATLRLKVTPQITPNNKVLLHLDVNQDALGEELKSGIPLINTRHISTNVLVDNGETVVLGGIYERTKAHSITRVPFISAIPIIGELFKHRSTKDSRKELLIFVTPRIIDNNLTS